MYRRLILGVVVAVFLAAEWTESATKPEASRNLHVGTLNTGLGDFAADVKSWPERAGALARLVSDLDLDLLALQEMWLIDWEQCDPEFRQQLESLGVTSDTSKAGILQERLPAGYTIHSELIPSEDRRRATAGLSWGLAVVTRLKVLDSEPRLLSIGDVDRYPRLVQRLRWRRPSGGSTGSLFNVHLSGESHRSRMSAALEIVDYTRHSAGSLKIVAGDLNAAPLEGPLHVLLSDFRDLWDVAGEKRVVVAGRPANASGALFRMTEEARIDYVLADSARSVEECGYRFDDLEPVALSDHPLVICRLD
jgi:endonuclease/exonuclease/phosphatase family metal-dependent hydrolase